MNCPRCGSVLSESNAFCPSCGEMIHSSYTTSGTPATTAKTDPNRTRKIVIIASVCVVLIASLWLLSIYTAKESLKKELMRDWSRVESGNGTYYTLELDFSEDEIEYNFDSFYYDANIANCDYEVVSGNQIRVNGGAELYTIEFNSDRTMMTITPALTSTASSEHWFHFED